MTKKEREMNIQLIINYAEEIKMLASSLVEDIYDSVSVTEAWNKMDCFYSDVERLRNKQKATGSKSFSIMNGDVDGHTKYLQGLDLPIMVNSISDGENLKPSPVSEMHIGNVDGKTVLLVTPEIISL
jgi:hypothetical protein